MEIFSFVWLSNILFQVNDIKGLLEYKAHFALAYQWVVTLVAFVLTVLYFRYERKETIYPFTSIIILRQSIACLDFEMIRLRFDHWKLQIFVIV